MNLIFTTLAVLCSAFLVRTVSSQQCGRQAGGAVCPGFVCCSNWGFCGTTEPWCGATCQNRCWSQERSDHRCGSGVGNPPCGQNRCCSIHGWCGGGSSFCAAGNCQYRCSTSAGDLSLPPSRNLSSNSVGDFLKESVFDDMFGHRKDCPSQGFYSYHAFLVAAEFFPGFGTVGDVALRKREVAAFLAQISQVTTGKWSDVEDPNGWGLCHINSTSSENDYCASSNWPCASPEKYANRGAIQLAYNSNYGLAGQAIGEDLINNPELVATDPIVSFKTAIWFWMTRHHNKPSCHEILVKVNSGSTRVPLSHVGVIGEIIQGALGHRVGDVTMTASSSIGYYKRYCDMLGVSYGSHDLSDWFDNPSSGMARIQMPVEA